MYLLHVTQENERWDLLAHRYYGNALEFERIIAANPRIPITPVLPSGRVLSIPVIEKADTLIEDLPPWMK